MINSRCCEILFFCKENRIVVIRLVSGSGFFAILNGTH